MINIGMVVLRRCGEMESCAVFCGIIDPDAIARFVEVCEFAMLQLHHHGALSDPRVEWDADGALSLFCDLPSGEEIRIEYSLENPFHSPN